MPAVAAQAGPRAAAKDRQEQHEVEAHQGGLLGVPAARRREAEADACHLEHRGCTVCGPHRGLLPQALQQHIIEEGVRQHANREKLASTA